MHFTLVDQTLLALMHEFDGVLDGEDVLIAGAVHVVHHRGECRTLARACRPCHYHQSSREIGHVAEDLTHAELFHR